MIKENKIKLKGGYIPSRLEGEELERFLMERKRGCGSHKSQKDYKRREKHQKRLWQMEE